MRRRDFLIGGSGALAGLVVGSAGDTVLERLVPAGTRPEVLTLDTWLGTLRGVSPVGIRWLEILGSEAPDGPSLARSLGDRLAMAPGVAIELGALEGRVRGAVEDDYREGRTCDVDGWHLSRMECDIAAAHVLHLGDSVDSGGPGLREGEIVAVEAWGPRSTLVGEPFNVQSDGHSGLWFRARGAPAWLSVVVDGDAMPTRVSADVVTSGLHGETMERVLSKSGRYRIEFVDEMAGVRQAVGDLVVVPAPVEARLEDGSRSEVFCQIENWGPRRTRPGVPVNAQPDGSIGVWILTGCMPEGTVVWAGDTALETQVALGRVTARLPVALTESEGVLEMTLRDAASGEALPVGEFVVSP